MGVCELCLLRLLLGQFTGLASSSIHHPPIHHPHPYPRLPHAAQLSTQLSRPGSRRPSLVTRSSFCRFLQRVPTREAEVIFVVAIIISIASCSAARVREGGRQLASCQVSKPILRTGAERPAAGCRVQGLLFGV